MKFELKNECQIDSMQLPENWGETKSAKTSANDQLREFVSGANEDVKLCFYYRGKTIAAGAARDFHGVLQEPDHILTEEEIESLSIVLRNAAYAESFSTSSIKTQTIKGKRVLIVEGIWRVNQIFDLSIFIDSDNTGSAVQEIHFFAPALNHANYLKEAHEAIESITWKSDN
ncbi:MAG: hypothetical protein Q8T09_01950 [Candidatus Melainabacteria bacterium]|nr:hypothetical protein [Candidatus Melainabacteria bacterium]